MFAFICPSNLPNTNFYMNSGFGLLASYNKEIEHLALNKYI